MEPKSAGRIPELLSHHIMGVPIFVLQLMAQGRIACASMGKSLVFPRVDKEFDGMFSDRHGTGSFPLFLLLNDYRLCLDLTSEALVMLQGLSLAHLGLEPVQKRGMNHRLSDAVHNRIQSVPGLFVVEIATDAINAHAKIVLGKLCCFPKEYLFAVGHLKHCRGVGWAEIRKSGVRIGLYCVSFACSAALSLRA